MQRLLFLFILMWLLATAGLQAQDKPKPPCEQVKLGTDQAKITLLQDYITRLEKERYFINDKGIVKLIVYQDTAGKKRWELSPLLDDRYKDNPPRKFAEFNGDIFLVYEGDQHGSIPQTPNSEALNRCLAEIIGDRVYIRPQKQERWSSEAYTTASGKRMSLGKRRGATGNWGALLVLFNEDGTYYETILPH